MLRSCEVRADAFISKLIKMSSSIWVVEGDLAVIWRARSGDLAAVLIWRDLALPDLASIWQSGGIEKVNAKELNADLAKRVIWQRGNPIHMASIAEHGPANLVP